MEAKVIQRESNIYENLIKDILSKQKIDCLAFKTITNPILCLQLILLPDGRLLLTHDGLEIDPLKVLSILAEYINEEFELDDLEKERLKAVIGLLNKELSD